MKKYFVTCRISNVRWDITIDAHEFGIQGDSIIFCINNIAVAAFPASCTVVIDSEIKIERTIP